MTYLQGLPQRDIERLSAYLDGELKPGELARLNARLEREENLSRALGELREAVWLMRSLPEVSAPRHFTLTHAMMGQRPRPRAYPVMQLATALAAAAFIIVLGVDAFTGMVLRSAPSASEFGQVALEAAVEEAVDVLPAPAEADLPSLGALAEATTGPVQEELRAAAVEAEDRVAATPLPAGEAAPEGEALGFSAEAPAPTTVDSPPEEAAKAAGMEDEFYGEGEVDTIPVDEVTQIAPEQTEAPQAYREVTPEPRAPGLLRILELSLGGLTVLLGIISVWIRRKT